MNFKILFVIFLPFFFCMSILNAKESEKLAILISKTEMKKLGFKSKTVRISTQSEWDKKEFGVATVIEQDIKSLKSMKGEKGLFPRYTVIKETYENAELALTRLKRLRDHDPSLNSKNHSGLVLRDGFVTGKDVWIITTNAVIFSREELQKIKNQLSEIKIKKLRGKE